MKTVIENVIADSPIQLAFRRAKADCQAASTEMRQARLSAASSTKNTVGSSSMKERTVTLTTIDFTSTLPGGKRAVNTTLKAQCERVLAMLTLGIAKDDGEGGYRLSEQGVFSELIAAENARREANRKASVEAAVKDGTAKAA